MLAFALNYFQIPKTFFYNARATLGAISNQWGPPTIAISASRVKKDRPGRSGISKVQTSTPIFYD
jgi:hypothetical protein